MLNVTSVVSNRLKNQLNSVGASWPGIKSAATVLFGALTMVLASKLYVPVKPVPFTGQTMGVLLIALTMTPINAFGSLLTWISMGAMGLPVFASHVVASEALVGPTAGYIFGMLLSATMGSWLNQHKAPAVQQWLSRRFGISQARAVFISFIMIGLAGDALILSLGWARLSTYTGFYQAWQLGVLPLLLWDALKIVTTSLVVASSGLNKKFPQA